MPEFFPRIPPGKSIKEREAVSTRARSSLKRQQKSRTLALCSNATARARLEFDKAQELGVLPVGIIKEAGSDVLRVASSSTMNENQERETIQILRFLTGTRVELTAVDAEVLKDALVLAYLGDEGNLFESKELLNQRCEIAQKKKSKEVTTALVLNDEDSEGAYLHSLLYYAHSHKATDIHLIPAKGGSLLRIRVNGKLITHGESVCTLSTHERLIRRLKVLCRLPVVRASLPVDGAFSDSFSGIGIAVRVSVMPTIYGERAALRLLHGRRPLPLEQIGFTNFTLNSLSQIRRETEGAVLFCGATGSGKTTAAYAYLSSFKYSSLNIVSIEDPVEAELEGVVQTSVNSAQGLSFTDALYGMLRQDPDVMLLGEMRNGEAAKIAMEAALTGHLLVSTLHCSTVFSLFDRMKQLEVDSDVLSSALKLVVSVKLVPLLCRSCKVIDLEPSRATGFDVYQSAGCTACDYTGSEGRQMVEQVLVIDSNIARLVRESRFSFDEFSRVLHKTNYQPFASSALGLLREGSITLRQYAGLAQSSWKMG